MSNTNYITIIEIVASAVVFALGFVGFSATRNSAKSDDATVKQKKKHRFFLIITIISVWFFIGTIITSISKKSNGFSVNFELFSDRINILGISFAKTTALTWVFILIILMLSLVFRYIVFPKFNMDCPKGFQNVIELSVEAMENFTKGVIGSYNEQLAPYMYSLAVFMIFAEISELFGLRPPTSDIVVTFSMGIITFVLINYYGIRKRGLAGRIKGLAKPTPIIFPMKILSDVAVPVSLACRLFGNMLGGMIVMDLLKSVLGGYATGIPAVAGLYFNVFHPLIQTYIFIILSLTFINEAVE